MNVCWLSGFLSYRYFNTSESAFVMRIRIRNTAGNIVLHPSVHYLFPCSLLDATLGRYQYFQNIFAFKLLDEQFTLPSTLPYCKIQGCGSGSGLDPDSVTLWIRIRIWNPDPDPGARK
jgi:hypothetical protein